MSRSARGQTDLPTDQTLDYCERCDADLPHIVSIELRYSDDGQEKGCYRSPFRVASCVGCGEETVERAPSM